MHLTLVNLLGVATIAFCIPFILGFFPRLRVSSAPLELVAGILFGPACLGWISPGPVVSVMATIGVAFLLFLAGLDLELEIMKGAPLRRGALSFLVSFALAYVLTRFLGAKGVILSPLLAAIALSATSVGIIGPFLRDVGMADTTFGRFTMSGASMAEVGTIALLGVFFAEKHHSPAVSASLLAVVAVLAVLLVAALHFTRRLTPASGILDKLDDTSAQARVRFSVMVFLAAATVAMKFGFEGILGSFVAGAIVGFIVRGDRFKSALHTKLKAIGFGLFVPAFFVTSGMQFQLSEFTGLAEIGRAFLFFLALIVIKTIPTVLYRPFLTWRECLASGILQATNLSFIVVAVAVGAQLGLIREINGAALILAGLASAIFFPSIAATLLANSATEVVAPSPYPQQPESPLPSAELK
jgi:Kef-type K+ transport system membrane component KefB